MLLKAKFMGSFWRSSKGGKLETEDAQLNFMMMHSRRPSTYS